MSSPNLFIPPALAQLIPVREGRIARDLTMPERDWSVFDRPTYQRRAMERAVDEAKWKAFMSRKAP